MGEPEPEPESTPPTPQNVKLMQQHWSKGQNPDPHSGPWELEEIDSFTKEAVSKTLAPRVSALSDMTTPRARAPLSEATTPQAHTERPPQASPPLLWVGPMEAGTVQTEPAKKLEESGEQTRQSLSPEQKIVLRFNEYIETAQNEINKLMEKTTLSEDDNDVIIRLRGTIDFYKTKISKIPKIPKARPIDIPKKASLKYKTRKHKKTRKRKHTKKRKHSKKRKKSKSN